MFARRLPALALTFSLAAGNLAVCAGWAATPEARMACCTGGACPMHASEPGTAASGPITQAQADGCCAASEHGDSTESTSSVATALSGAVLGSGIILPSSVPILVLSDSWRIAVPIPSTPVPKHLLLSVFLV